MNRQKTETQRNMHTLKHTNIHVMGVPKVEKRAEKIFEKMMIEKKNDLYIQERRQTTIDSNNRFTPRHMIVKAKNEEKNLQISKRKKDDSSCARESQ